MKGLILHGNAIAYKAYYSLPSIPGRRGERESILSLFTRIILKLLAEFSPTHTVAVFDEPAPCTRKKGKFTYSISHPLMPPSLRENLSAMKEVLSSLGIRVLEMPGYGADDVIAAVTQRFLKEGIEVYIVSHEKSLWQLLSGKVKIINPFKNYELMDEVDFKQKIGIIPGWVPDYLALMGDESLNIPGVEGIGEKRAVSLLGEFGTLEKALSSLSLLPPGIKEKLQEKQSSLLLSKRVAKLQKNIRIAGGIQKWQWKGWEEEKLKNTFQKLGLYEVLFPLLKPEGERKNYRAVLSEEAFSSLLQEVEKCELISLDTETSSPVPMQADIVGVTLCLKPHHAFYIPLRHQYLGVPPQLKEDNVLNALQPYLENKKIAGQNLKYDYIVLRRKGIKLKNIVFDTMLAAHLLSPTGELYNLRSLSIRYLGERKKAYKEVVGKGEIISGVSIEEVTQYTCEDVDFALRLKNVLERELEKKGLKKLFEEVEMPLLTVLAEMEIRGVKVEVEALRKLQGKVEAEIEEVSREIFRVTGEVFNLSSPKQVSHILFDKLGLPRGKRTKTGYSTSQSILENLAGTHEVIDYLLKVRGLQKVLQGFILPLLESVNPSTGRIHTSFRQAATSTGRLSSSNPNLQNIPIRGKWGKELRKCFVAEEGYQILSADYSQIELRVIAHLSGDEKLKESFLKGEDIHTSTACQIFSVSESEVTSEMRRKAKAVNFGIIYGISAYGLSRQIQSSVEEAGRIIKNYFQLHPAVKEYIDSTLKSCREKGYVSTLLGRRRYIPRISFENRVLREQAEREAINTPVQGSAAEIIKIAMINLHQELIKRKSGAFLILQVHDEVLLEVPEEEKEEIFLLVKEIMENAYPLSVPLTVEANFGRSWWEAG